MAKVTVKNEFNVDADKLWGKVRQFNDMHKFLPSMITSCEVQGGGEGAKRVCTTEHGKILETLRFLDDENMILRYSIDNEDAPMPVKDYIGAASVMRLSENKAEFTWSATFEPKGMPEVEVVDMLEGVFAALLNSIAESVER